MKTKTLTIFISSPDDTFDISAPYALKQIADHLEKGVTSDKMNSKLISYTFKVEEVYTKDFKEE